jgi:hypothetical protein
MIFLAPFILWLGLALFAVYMTTKVYKSKTTSKQFLGASDYSGGLFFAILIGGIVTIIIGINFLIAYSVQRSNFNDLQNLVEQRSIYEQKMTNMTAQYKEVLVNDYTSYEKGIFGDMKPEDASKLQTLLSVYPQLKASVTVSAYAENIKALNDDIYNTDIEIRKMVKEIRWNYQTPWVITSFMPDVPAHLTKYVNQ